MLCIGVEATEPSSRRKNSILSFCLNILKNIRNQINSYMEPKLFEDHVGFVWTIICSTLL